MTVQGFYEKYGIKYVDSDTLSNEKWGITPKIERILDKEMGKLQRKKASISHLRTLVKRYPSIPKLKNFLALAYVHAGLDEKAFEINQLTRKKHPDYFYGKINLVREYLLKKKLDNIPEILGKNFSITEFDPTTKTFSLSEVINYYSCVFDYYYELEKVDEASGIIDLLHDADPDDPVISSCRMRLVRLKIETGNIPFFDKKEDKALANLRKYDKSIQTDIEPVFQLSQTKDLYQYGLGIEEHRLKSFLTLPRQQLISDLEKILLDAHVRYEFWNKQIDENGWDDNLYSFPIHAIFLLAELNATESLNSIWELIRCDDEVGEFWFSDHLTETLWYAFYCLGIDQLEVLQAMILEDNVYTYSRSPVTTALSNIYFHQPSKKEKVLQVYENILTTFMEMHQEGKTVDPELTALVIVDLSDMKATHLLPKIKPLFENDLVNVWLGGDFEKISEIMFNKKETPIGYKTIYADIFELYDEFKKGWVHSLDPVNPNTVTVNPPKPEKETLLKKPGRNEPCICGSDKKFKRCCISKFK